MKLKPWSMAAVTITVVDIYLLRYLLILWFAIRYRAVVKSSYMLEHPKQHKYLNSNNLMSLDNQQERLVTSSSAFTNELKWFLSGFIDGEGSFCLNVKNRQDVKYGLRIEPAFYVYQHEKGIEILEMIRQMFGCGSIHRKTSPYNVFTYQISGIKPCYTKVIPFFKKYPLIVKSKTFNIFEEGVSFMNSKQHLTRNGMIHLVDLAYEINQQGKGKKWNKENIVTRILRG